MSTAIGSLSGLGRVAGAGPAALLAAADALGGIGPASGAATPSAPGSSGASPTIGPSPTIGAPGATGGSGATPGATGDAQSFVDSLGDALDRLNGQLVAADAAMADFAAGGSSDLHAVMLEMQQASIGLRLGIQVRDRLLEAYQEIMRLQV